MAQSAEASADTPLVEAIDLAKSFGAVQALRSGSLKLYPGEVHAIVGDNGAGKSTFIKMLAGVFQPDSGSIYVDGRHVSITTPQMAQSLGITTVHQTLALIDDLDVTANLFLGNEVFYPPPLSWVGLVRKRSMRRQAAEQIGQLNIGIRSVDELIAGFSGGQRQSIAVARAVMWGRHIVIMDEPTAALGVRESAQVHDLIRRCRDAGMGIIMISHDMLEVFDIADRATVFRLGKSIATVRISESDPTSVVGLITGASEAPRVEGAER